MITEARLLRSKGYAINKIRRMLGLRDYYLVRDWVKDVETPRDKLAAIARDYCKNTNLIYKKIAAILGVPPRTVATWCKDVQRPPTEIELKRQQVKRLCATTGMSYMDIARTAGVANVTVADWCRDIERPPLIYEEKRGRVISLWTNTTLSGAAIADTVGVSRPSVFKWTKNLKRPEKIHPRYHDVRRICADTHWGYKRISELYGDVSPFQVRSWCKDVERPEDPHIEKARHLYATTTMSIKDIATELGAGTHIVGAWCSDVDKYDPFQELKQQAIKLCQETDMSYSEIARQIGAKRSSIVNWCKPHREPKRRAKSGGGTRTPQQLEAVKSQVRDLWKTTDLTTGKIAAQVGVAKRSVSLWTKGLEREQPSWRERYDAKREEACKLVRTTKLSYKEIARRLDVTDSTVRKWCEGIRPKRRSSKPGQQLPRRRSRLRRWR